MVPGKLRRGSDRYKGHRTRFLQTRPEQPTTRMKVTIAEPVPDATGRRGAPARRGHDGQFETARPEPSGASFHGKRADRGGSGGTSSIGNGLPDWSPPSLPAGCLTEQTATVAGGRPAPRPIRRTNGRRPGRSFPTPLEVSRIRVFRMRALANPAIPIVPARRSTAVRPDQLLPTLCRIRPYRGLYRRGVSRAEPARGASRHGRGAFTTDLRGGPSQWYGGRLGRLNPWGGPA